jgi:hypothetical protein
VNDRLSFTPYVGFLLDQAHSVADKGSDVSFILTSTFKASDRITLDYSAIFPHVMLHPERADWINRFRIIYATPHTEITFFSWHNNRVFDHADYFSGGLSLNYKNISLSKRLYLSTGITGLRMMTTSDEESNPKRNGLLLTIALVFL